MISGAVVVFSAADDTRQSMALGGTPLANPAAFVDSWKRSLAFLHKQLD
jgi:dienelactone hydrolase